MSVGTIRNPLAAAAAWAERMSNPEATAARKKAETRQRREQEAQQPPIPEAEPVADASEQPPVVAPEVKRAKTVKQDAEGFRSVVWAGCIMLGVACSVIAFFIGMLR